PWVHWHVPHTNCFAPPNSPQLVLPVLSWSIHMKPTVEVEDLAGDESRERGREEQDRMRELLGLAEAPHRNLREDMAALLLVQLLGHHRRLHVCGGDRVHGHAV